VHDVDAHRKELSQSSIHPHHLLLQSARFNGTIVLLLCTVFALPEP
jgi:hypothetical protein